MYSREMTSHISIPVRRMRAGRRVVSRSSIQALIWAACSRRERTLKPDAAERSLSPAAGGMKGRTVKMIPAEMNEIGL